MASMLDRSFLSEAWLPKSVLCLRDYNLNKFLRDLVAGHHGRTGRAAAGHGIRDRVRPDAAGGHLLRHRHRLPDLALGGSKTQIGGPTGAFVVVIAGIVAAHGVDGLFMCTMMAGVMLVIMGLTGMGTAVKFIPRPIVIGFTNGIAILIASTQIKDFFGLKLEKVPGEFWLRMKALAQSFPTLSYEPPLGRRNARDHRHLPRDFEPHSRRDRRPGAGNAALVRVFHLPVETIGTRFGGIPSGLPHLAHSGVPPGTDSRTDLGPALTVAMLGAIESLMSAVVADRMSDDRHNPNVELVAQGVANIVSPMFGGLPATGAIARTATNIRSGAQTPVAGMIHALTLLVDSACLPRRWRASFPWPCWPAS